jgi:hypothetical protein
MITVDVGFKVLIDRNDVNLTRIGLEILSELSFRVEILTFLIIKCDTNTWVRVFQK